MSGVTSSKRQWASLRVRAVAAILLALTMLIPMVGVAMAQDQGAAAPADQGASWPPYPGANQMCIVGRVINFDETALPYSDLYTYAGDEPSVKWVITAVQLDSQAAALTAEPDKDGYFEFKDLSEGEWNISIGMVQGWEFVAPYTDNVTVSVGYGAKDCTRIRFKLRYPVTVEVLKIDDNHTPLEGWTIRAQPAHGNWFASAIEKETGADGKVTFSLTPGKWVFTEKAPKGTHFTPVVPQDGKQELNVDPKGSTPGVAKYTLRFKNRLYDKGCIVVTKSDVPPMSNETKGGMTEGSADATMSASTYGYGLPGWKIWLKRPNGTIAAEGVTDALGNVKFDKLPYGPYIVMEENRIGWEPVGPTAVQVVLTPEMGDSCAEVGFTNRQRPAGFCIEGYKIDDNEHIGIPNWVITATVVTKGGYPDAHVDGMSAITTTTDGTGKYVFEFPTDDYRIPGAAYKVCEESRAGWLPHTATCQTVYLPWKPSACVRARDFVNQQVGHSEAKAYGHHSSSGYGCSSSHTVKAGESLYGIGNAYGVSASAMLAANSWVSNRPHHYVYPGDSVCIP